MFKLNLLCDTCEKSFDLFLLYLSTRFFLVLGVLYERSWSTKGVAQTPIFFGANLINTSILGFFT